ncbi:MAG: three-Cys-motif partner protein TcmP [Candidatus Andeanibacterium colombiense]|uniref:Three-Cys-motif partner protein TcmP n=1 Tax=Candidatus Andeanibacterium colombiense TaxID=3121345 RepID=A0AAJ5X1S7_9SPHN|nr:MAG: three-Cys-motif partner protein TcmP [Sphingomonadaceae bacterium]
MTAQAFGDQYTKQKLDTVEKYLRPYASALKNQSFKLLYIDACAGSGSSIPKSATKAEEENARQDLLGGFAAPVFDADQILTGSAVRALGIEPPFYRYLFNDLKRSNVHALSDIVRADFSHLEDRIEITQLDANKMLLDVCSAYDWNKTRAVVFLDPFGLQINYETLLALGRTKAVDLWYLVPVFAMYRQVSGDGHINPDGGPRVDAALGTTAWRDVAVVEQHSNDLFDLPQLKTERAVDIAWFEKIAKERIGEAFGGRVLDETLRLGKDSIHYFSLMFAWANPSPKANELAKRLARAVLK